MCPTPSMTTPTTSSRTPRPKPSPTSRAAGPAAPATWSPPHSTAPLAALNSPERRISFEAVLAVDAAALRNRFKNKSVLVGLVMPGEDVSRTFHGLSSETRQGLELHADATGALLGDRRVVQLLGFGAQLRSLRRSPCLAVACRGAATRSWLATRGAADRDGRDTCRRGGGAVCLCGSPDKPDLSARRARRRLLARDAGDTRTLTF